MPRKPSPGQHPPSMEIGRKFPTQKPGTRKLEMLKSQQLIIGDVEMRISFGGFDAALNRDF